MWLELAGGECALQLAHPLTHLLADELARVGRAGNDRCDVVRRELGESLERRRDLRGIVAGRGGRPDDPRVGRVDGLGAEGLGGLPDPVELLRDKVGGEALLLAELLLEHPELPERLPTLDEQEDVAEVRLAVRVEATLLIGEVDEEGPHHVLFRPVREVPLDEPEVRSTSLTRLVTDLVDLHQPREDLRDPVDRAESGCGDRAVAARLDNGLLAVLHRRLHVRNLDDASPLAEALEGGCISLGRGRTTLGLEVGEVLLPRHRPPLLLSTDLHEHVAQAVPLIGVVDDGVDLGELREALGDGLESGTEVLRDSRVELALRRSAARTRSRCEPTSPRKLPSAWWLVPPWLSSANCGTSSKRPNSEPNSFPSPGKASVARAMAALRLTFLETNMLPSLGTLSTEGFL